MIAESENIKTPTPMELDRLAPVIGRWQIDAAKAEFIGFDDSSFKIGVALSNVRTTSGRFQISVTLSEIDQGAAHFVVGYDPLQQTGYTIGLGGYDQAYSVTQCFLPRSSRKLFGV